MSDCAPSGAEAEVAERVEALEALYAALPGGYECDKELSTYNDSQTYGEIATADITLLAAQVSCPRSLNFADLGSGLGKLSIAAGWLFQSSLGVENAPQRAAVASSALEKLGADAPRNVTLVCGDLLLVPLADVQVVFSHNLVFSRALERAMELKLDRELAPGSHVFVVAELRYTQRGALIAEHAASYGWASDGKRPLYHYRFAGEPISAGSDEED